MDDRKIILKDLKKVIKKLGYKYPKKALQTFAKKEICANRANNFLNDA